MADAEDPIAQLVADMHVNRSEVRAKANALASERKRLYDAWQQPLNGMINGISTQLEAVGVSIGYPEVCKVNSDPAGFKYQVRQSQGLIGSLTIQVSRLGVIVLSLGSDSEETQMATDFPAKEISAAVAELFRRKLLPKS